MPDNFGLQLKSGYDYTLGSVNLGADYTIGKFCFSLNVNNLFNTRYNRSGMDAPLIPQQGRWFMASIGVKL